MGLISKTFLLIALSVVSVIVCAQQEQLVLSKKKVLAFGSDYDYPPYEFLDDKGEPTGFNIDLIRAIGKEMNYDVTVQLGIWTEIRKAFEDSLGYLNVADMIYSEKRAQHVRFLPHHDVISYVMVSNQHAPPIETLDEVTHQTIVVTAKAIGEEYINKNAPTVRTAHSITDQHALQMVASGKFNYALVNQYTAHKYIEEHDEAKISISEKIVFSEKLAFVVKKQDSILYEVIETGMKRIRANGTYSELYIKWFDNQKDEYEKLTRLLKWIVFVLFTSAIMISTWVYVLRRQVMRKTAQIRNEMHEKLRTQKLLAEKNKELEKRNYELDKFVYSVYHSVSSPIATALGLVKIIEIEFGEHANLMDYVKEISTSLYKLNHYVNKILAYVANKNSDVKKQRICFEELIHQLIEESKFIDGAEDVVFLHDVVQEIPFYSDVDRIYLILECLIANAITYKIQRTEKSFVSISVNVTHTQAIIVIRDNGEGIQKEQLEKVFEMFYRGNQRSKGTGLGLYVVKQTVQKLNGEVHIESDSRVGTSVTLHIPNLSSDKEDKKNNASES